MIDQPHEFDQQGDVTELDKLLIALYVRYGTPVDSLAYSDTFERMYEELRRNDEDRTKGEIFRRLLMFRKSGRLPRLDLAVGKDNG